MNENGCFSLLAPKFFDKVGQSAFVEVVGNFLVVYEVVMIETRKANLLVVILFAAHHTSKHLITLIFLLIKVHHLIDLPEEISFHDLLACKED